MVCGLFVVVCGLFVVSRGLLICGLQVVRSVSRVVDSGTPFNHPFQFPPPPPPPPPAPQPSFFESRGLKTDPLNSSGLGGRWGGLGLGVSALGSRCSRRLGSVFSLSRCCAVALPALPGKLVFGVENGQAGHCDHSKALRSKLWRTSGQNLTAKPATDTKNTTNPTNNACQCFNR